MEEEKGKNMSKKEANKYMRFLIKEWSEADNEVWIVICFLLNRRLESTRLLPWESLFHKTRFLWNKQWKFEIGLVGLSTSAFI